MTIDDVLDPVLACDVKSWIVTHFARYGVDGRQAALEHLAAVLHRAKKSGKVFKENEAAPEVPEWVHRDDELRSCRDAA